MKKCTKCKEEKPKTFDYFYRNKAIKNGYTLQCKSCMDKYSGKYNKIKGTEYKTWAKMRERCNNKNAQNYHRYGGRGIKICSRWDDYHKFLKDMGKKPHPSYSIDRIDNEGNYTPENCKWSNDYEQARNKRTIKNTPSGRVGVTWNKKQKEWVVRIQANDKRTHIGSFENLEDAIEARKQAELKYWNKQNTL